MFAGAGPASAGLEADWAMASNPTGAPQRKFAAPCTRLLRRLGRSRHVNSFINVFGVRTLGIGSLPCAGMDLQHDDRRGRAASSCGCHHPAGLALGTSFLPMRGWPPCVSCRF